MLAPAFLRRIIRQLLQYEFPFFLWQFQQGTVVAGVQILYGRRQHGNHRLEVLSITSDLLPIL